MEKVVEAFRRILVGNKMFYRFQKLGKLIINNDFTVSYSTPQITLFTSLSIKLFTWFHINCTFETNKGYRQIQVSCSDDSIKEY